MNILFLTTDEEPLFNQFKNDLKLSVLVEKGILDEYKCNILATLFTKLMISTFGVEEKYKRRVNISFELQKLCQEYLGCGTTESDVCADYCISMFNINAVANKTENID